MYEELKKRNSSHIVNPVLCDLISKNLVIVEPYDFLNEPLVEIPEKEVEKISNDVRRLKLIDIDSVPELCLQCNSKFMLDYAYDLVLDSMSDVSSNIWLQESGGGKIAISNLTDPIHKIEFRQNRFYADIEIRVKSMRDSLLLQNGVVPYVAFYELKRTALQEIQEESEFQLAQISSHKDFLKIITELRSTMRGYAFNLHMDEKDLKKITLWGILQSGFQVWFLRCRCQIMSDGDQPTIQVRYVFQCSSSALMLNKLEDALCIVKLCCRIIDDAAILKNTLELFTTSQRDLLNTADTYGISYEEAYLDDFVNQNSLMRYINNSDLVSIARIIGKLEHSCSNWRLTDPHKSVKYLAFNTAARDCENSRAMIYALCSENRLQQCKINYQPGNMVWVIFKIENIPNILGYFEFTTEPQSFSETANFNNQEEDPHTPTRDNNRKDNNHFTAPNQQVTNASQPSNQSSNQQQQDSSAKPTTRKFVSSEEILETALKEYDPDISAVKKWKRSSSLFVTTLDSFIKLSVCYFDEVEAETIMNQLKCQTLYHRNLYQILEYRVMKRKPLVVMSKSELLIGAVEFFGKSRFSVANEEGLLNWIKEDLIMSSLNGLEYLHNNEIIHGDLSFGNIMFRKDKETDEYYAVIIDLNSSVYKNEQTGPYRLFGKPGYFPIGERSASVFSDCYSWIVTMCNFLYVGLFNRKYAIDDEEQVANWHEKLQLVFHEKSWRRYAEGEALNVFLNKLKFVFETIVIEKDKKVTANWLKSQFSADLFCRPPLTSIAVNVQQSTEKVNNQKFTLLSDKENANHIC